MPTRKPGDATPQQPQQESKSTGSSTTMHKATASKAFLENHYRSMLRGLKQQEAGGVQSPVSGGGDTSMSNKLSGSGSGSDGRSDARSGGYVVLGSGTGTVNRPSSIPVGGCPTPTTVSMDVSGVPHVGGATVVRPRKREIRPSDFTLLKCVGRGAFGDVYICSKNTPTDVSLDSTGSRGASPIGRSAPKGSDGQGLYAMKRMRKADMLKKKQVLHVRSERNVLAEASQVNPYVVQLYYSFQDDNYLYMVTEYVPGGDLMSWLISEQIFTVEQTRFYIAELCMAIKSVHEMDYVHRDIKPDNILIDSRGHAKLSDFGLCKKFELPSKKERQRWLQTHKAKTLWRAERALQQSFTDGSSLMPDDYNAPLHPPTNIKGDIYTGVDGSSGDEVVIDSDDGEGIQISSGRQSGGGGPAVGGQGGLNNTNDHDDDDVVDLYEELEDDEANKKHIITTNNTASNLSSISGLLQGHMGHFGENLLSSNSSSLSMTNRNLADSRNFPEGNLDNSNSSTSMSSISTVRTDALAKSTLKEAIKRRQRFESIVGSPGYIAPEILLKQSYGINCDYWSVGVIMYEMLYGGPPFYAEDPQTTCSKIVNWKSTLRFPKPDGRHIPYVPPEAIDLMKHLMCDMDNRYDFEQIKAHPFFSNVDWDNLQAVEPVADMEHHRKNSVSARGSKGLCVKGGGSNGDLAPFSPQLSHPLDTRYFPDMDNRQRLADDQHMQLMKAEDPRGVIFADFKFKRGE